MKWTTSRPIDESRQPISNGSLIAGCPFHETGKHMLQHLSRGRR
jgi:hypothetical protein